MALQMLLLWPVTSFVSLILFYLCFIIFYWNTFLIMGVFLFLNLELQQIEQCDSLTLKTSKDRIDLSTPM